MSAGPVVDRVYAQLRDRLGGRHYRPGERLEVTELCADLASSTTPVRDALNRLLGEGLVAAPAREGFNVPSFDEPGLADLYRWSGEVLRLALAATPQGSVLALEPCGDPASYADRVAALFASISSRSENGEHARALDRISARLSPARCMEPELFPDIEREFEDLRTLSAALEDGHLRRALRRYHARRVQRSSALVRLLYRARP